ncbi:unnamed protein product [Darwinula stevensoni]|uniref:Uncharacterized protein n=1 Tax=Darwinula stevensoni TaxID=69355 RepID=A0A7R9A578_9CRUS|nr:unnamed protein product [Darwinula stevensoni]CAG0893846.1 unnamed protein product [Darwinula stevensoni]
MYGTVSPRPHVHPPHKMNGSILSGRGTPHHNMLNASMTTSPHPVLLNASKASNHSPGTNTTVLESDQPVTRVMRIPLNSTRIMNSPPPPPPPNRNLVSNYFFPKSFGVREHLVALCLLCVISLLLSLLALVFLLRVSRFEGPRHLREEFDPFPMFGGEDGLRKEEWMLMHELSLALTALTLSLDICCLLVSAVQFVFAVKLLKSPHGQLRTAKYLKDSSRSQSCAIGGFFLSVPIFLTGVILYTFMHFHSRSAIVTSILLGLGVLFCGIAMIHNVYIWQKDKSLKLGTRGYKKKNRTRSPIPPVTISGPLELSGISSTHAHELSTLV